MYGFFSGKTYGLWGMGIYGYLIRNQLGGQKFLWSMGEYGLMGLWVMRES
jgi:hypothetical protein